MTQNHVSQSPAYWRDRSYFFGYGSPFGFYLGYPWWWPGYGYRFGYSPWFAYGVGRGRIWVRLRLPVPGLSVDVPYSANNNPTVALAAAQNGPPNEQLENSLDYASQGEVAFRDGKYQQAVQDWRHALVDDPQNGAIVLLLSQALFAVGQHVEAAGALQAALQMLPEDKWGTVVVHYKELYPNIQAYTDQIRAAEKLRNANPEMPALHLLLGYHFGYLGYPKEAVKELKKAVELSPKDEIARKLYDTFSAKLGEAPKPAEEDIGAGRRNRKPPLRNREPDGPLATVSLRLAQRHRGIAGLQCLSLGQSLVEPLQANLAPRLILAVDAFDLFGEVGDGSIKISNRHVEATTIAIVDGFRRLEPDRFVVVLQRSLIVLIQRAGNSSTSKQLGVGRIAADRRREILDRFLGGDDTGAAQPARFLLGDPKPVALDLVDAHENPRFHGVDGFVLDLQLGLANHHDEIAGLVGDGWGSRAAKSGTGRPSGRDGDEKEGGGSQGLAPSKW